MVKQEYVQTRKEELINSISHGAGALLAIIGAAPLIMHGIQAGSAKIIFSMAAYVLSLVLLYTASASYHAVKRSTVKRILQVLDHCTIFVLILGTYIPFSLVIMGGAVGLTVCLTNTVLAVIGITLNVIDMKRFEKYSMILYILMGWLAIAVVPAIFKAMPLSGLILLIAGGVAYTAGIVFFKTEKSYMHVTWHFFVLAGSVLQYFSILVYLKA